MFVAQPAEELVSGADAMLADGLFTRFGKPDFICAAHLAAALRHRGLQRGRGHVQFRRAGDHLQGPRRPRLGADKALDPIVIAAKFITDVQTVVGREGSLRVRRGHRGRGAGPAAWATSSPTRRCCAAPSSYKPEVRAKLLDGVRRTAKAAALMASAPSQGDAAARRPAVVNAERGEHHRAVLKDTLGARERVPRAAITASEDFQRLRQPGRAGYVLLRRRGQPQQFMDSLKPGGKLPFNHSPQFAPVPERRSRRAWAMSMAVLNVMAGKLRGGRRGQFSCRARPMPTSPSPNDAIVIVGGGHPLPRLLRQRPRPAWARTPSLVCAGRAAAYQRPPLSRALQERRRTLQPHRGELGTPARHRCIAAMPLWPSIDAARRLQLRSGATLLHLAGARHPAPIRATFARTADDARQRGGVLRSTADAPSRLHTGSWRRLRKRHRARRRFHRPGDC